MKPIKLTAQEAALLKAFSQNPADVKVMILAHVQRSGQRYTDEFNALLKIMEGAT